MSDSFLNALTHPLVANPVAAMGNALDVAKGAYAIRQQQANQAVGQALQGAIDAQGNLDPQRFRQNLAAAGPVAAMAAGEGLQNIQNIGSNQYQMDVSRRNIVNGIIVGAQSIKDPQQQMDYLTRQGGLLIRNGIMPPEQVLNAFGSMPTDPAARQQYLEAIRVQNLPPELQQANIYGAPFRQTGPGGTTIGGMQSVTTGAVSGPPQAGLPQGMGPGEAATPVTWQDEQGVTQHTTLQQYGDAVNGGRRVGPAYDARTGAPVAGGGPNAPTAPSPTNQPRLNQPAQPGRPASLAGPTPGDPNLWEASANAYGGAMTDASNYSQRTWPIVQALSILKTNPPSTGVGADTLNNIRSAITTLGRFAGADITSINQANYEELHKYLQQAVNAQPMAQRSDASLVSALGGSPGTHLSDLSNEQILKSMLAMERMKMAAVRDFTAQGGHPRDWLPFMQRWQTTHDPRAFMMDQMSDPELKAMFQRMSPRERASYAATLRLVQSNPDIMSDVGMGGANPPAAAQAAPATQPPAPETVLPQGPRT